MNFGEKINIYYYYLLILSMKIQNDRLLLQENLNDIKNMISSI